MGWRSTEIAGWSPGICYEFGTIKSLVTGMKHVKKNVKLNKLTRLVQVQYVAVNIVDGVRLTVSHRTYKATVLFQYIHRGN